MYDTFETPIDVRHFKGTFQGTDTEYVLYGSLAEGALLITEDALSHFGDAYAALKPNGEVFREGAKIGTFADFKITGESTVTAGCNATEEEKELVTQKAMAYALAGVIASLLKGAEGLAGPEEL